MRHFALASVLLLASAQLAIAETFNITVGGPGVLKFDPPFVNAKVDDIVRFIFRQKNHTVTQSTLANPCTPLANGFDTGFMFVPDNQTTGFRTAQLTVRNTNPIWAYCRQGTHCRAGMVFAVNPTNASELAAFQAAATGGTPSSSSSVSSTSASLPTSSGSIPSSTDHKVIVGGPNLLTFNPSNITAQAGDTITFEFHEKNHTVTASSFGNPCTQESGFDSGFKPSASGSTSFPTYVVQVNDTKPIWAFCRQGTHCKSGMVFSVNAPESSSQNFEAFRALAMNPSSSSSDPYGGPSGSAATAWRPAVGSSSMAVVLVLVVALLL